MAEARRVANFWRRPGHTPSANNVLQFLEATPHPLGEIGVGRELTEITYRADAWSRARRLIVVRQSVTRKQAPGKNLSRFADDPDLQGWRYGAFVTRLDLPAVEVWRRYRGRADCDKSAGSPICTRSARRVRYRGMPRAYRIKALKADFGLEACNLRDFWATEAALGFARLAYTLMSRFRQAVLRSRAQPTLSTLHGPVLAIGGSWHPDAKQQRLLLSVPRRKRAGFAASGPTPPLLR